MGPKWWKECLGHIRRAVPLENPRGDNPIAAPTEAPDHPIWVLAQYGTNNNNDGGVIKKASMLVGVGGDPDIGGDPVYDGGSLSLMVDLFIGGSVTYESNTPTPNDVDVGAPDFCSNDPFFIDEFRNNLDADEFYDAVETIHKTGKLATDTTISTPGEKPPPSDHPGNQDYD